jgi:hypothetical protein
MPDTKICVLNTFASFSASPLPVNHPARVFGSRFADLIQFAGLITVQMNLPRFQVIGQLFLKKITTKLTKSIHTKSPRF